MKFTKIIRVTNSRDENRSTEFQAFHRSGENVSCVLGEINPNTTKPSDQLKLPCGLTFPLVIKTLITTVKENPAYKGCVPKDLTPDICVEIVRLLTEARKQQGLSQNSLATKAKVTQSLVSGLEKDPWNPTIGTLLRIAEGLGVDLGDVITEARKTVSKDSGKSS